MQRSLDSFLDAPTPIIPISLGAEALGLTSTGAKKLIADGKLEEVVIEADGADRVWRGVTVESVNKVIQESRIEEELVSKARAFLEARKGEPVEYKPFMEMLGWNHRISRHRRAVGELLGDLSRETLRDPKREFLISALVIRKDTQMPSDIFFEFAEEEGEFDPVKDRQRKFFKKQIRKIRNFYKTS